jgi:uncharacterized protein YkwD
MHLSRRLFVIAGSAAFLSACSSVTTAPSGNSGTITPEVLTQDGIVRTINAARAANGGHAPWRYNTALERAARSQASLMVDKDQLSHDLGVTLRQRVTAAGYTTAVGENLAGGQRTLEQAIEGWLNSPGHRATLLSDKFVEFGLAVQSVPASRKSRYGVYWCLIAGGPFEAWVKNA